MQDGRTSSASRAPEGSGDDVAMSYSGGFLAGKPAGSLIHQFQQAGINLQACCPTECIYLENQPVGSMMILDESLDISKWPGRHTNTQADFKISIGTQVCSARERPTDLFKIRLKAFLIENRYDIGYPLGRGCEVRHLQRAIHKEIVAEQRHSDGSLSMSVKPDSIDDWQVILDARGVERSGQGFLLATSGMQDMPERSTL